LVACLRVAERVALGAMLFTQEEETALVANSYAQQAQQEDHYE